jgi:hypothetical protein
MEWTTLSAVYEVLHNGTPGDGHLWPKHVVLIAKTNVKEEINSCISDGKLYVNKVEYSSATRCLNTRFVGMLEGRSVYNELWIMMI